MILLKFRETANVPERARDAVSGYRWVLDISFIRGALSVSLIQQYQCVSTGEWFPGMYWYDCTINRHWFWDAQHIWYDGPHCNRSFGFVHFNWRRWDCEKCLSEARSDE